MRPIVPAATQQTLATLAMAVTFCLVASVGFAGGTPVDFSRQIRPILSDRCYKCHGPDEEAREADLRLDRRDDAEYVLDGTSEADNELLRRVMSDAPDERMPPPDSGLSLDERERGLLRDWVAAGAPFDVHWSFKSLGPVDVPSVGDTAWPRNEIDHFVQARHVEAGVSATPEAGRERLIRRLSFDLTGLPPTLEEIDEFLADEEPGAYERLVDRLLASSAFGERMTSQWLDVARYADSYGYQVDRDRRVWPWRDWVVRAFNENMPYDDFITQQLAGDLLPEADENAILATTFNRLHSQKVEGGSTPEEFRVEYVADRVHTFGTALMGLTLECARCHDHKYDPITQREYYQFFAFFNNIDEAGLYSYFTPAVPTPTLLLADDETKTKLAKLQDAVNTAEATTRQLADARREAFERWLADGRPSQPLIPGEVARLDFEGDIAGENEAVAGKIGKAVKLTGDDSVDLDVGNFTRHDAFSVTLWMQTPDVKERAVVYRRSAGWTDAGSRGYQLLIEDGRLTASLIHFWPGNALSVVTVVPIPVGEWLHVGVTYDGSSRADGLRIYIDGEPVECDVVRDVLTREITGGGSDNLAIGQRFRDRGFTGGLVDEFRVFARELTPLEVSQLAGTRALEAALVAEADSLGDATRHELFTYYLATADEPFAEQLAQLKQARTDRGAVMDAAPEIMVMRELAEPRPAAVLKRGAYNAPGDAVSANTPASFPPLPADTPRNRLALARWLTDPAHPLTARVEVNRVWQMLFGKGLVRTPEDFGSQGEPPTHPELLDWLAGDFIAHGWDVKRLVKQMVMSATYRQDSDVTPDRRKSDPDNRLLARHDRYRLDAEMLRDGALRVSGLLVDKLGGEPVRPYEVADSFKPVEIDDGEGLYRRSLYTYWKRTAPAPAMMALDAAKREVCTVKRERTASPLQALVVLNGPQFVEAARVLGERMVTRHPGDARAMAAEMFRMFTGRHASPDELEVLVAMHDEQLAYFQRDEAKAAEYVRVGKTAVGESLAAPDVAAAGVLAGALMSFDESMMKR
ncbi:MAG: DUF1553 domain-containing protein [Planctomycetales bacterium]|nr:DUF1553 domain-containing protein [Planctomycetales bacterium]